MEIDFEVVVGTEDYEELQRYFESRRNNYPSSSESVQNRIKNEYISERWEDNEKCEISDRCRALTRICRILEEIPSNEQESPIGKT